MYGYAVACSHAVHLTIRCFVTSSSVVQGCLCHTWGIMTAIREEISVMLNFLHASRHIIYR